jgi:hypothetical protein
VLGNDAGQVQHVIYLQFDNLHFNLDNPNVPSDLEQMPHLLNYLTQNGTLFTNDHTILISHTAGGILSSLTGLYPDRQGQTVSNSYDFFSPTGSTSFTSSFKYWTDTVDGASDSLPNMITTGQKMTPAPWVPYTRAGCDFGGVGTANIEFENISSDITTVFGANSPQAAEVKANPTLAAADFEGIAIHCAQTATSKCAGNASAGADVLPQEPGGYSGYQALYGAKYVDPAIAGGSACVNSISGTAIKDPAGNCGFPGFDGMLAANTLGYIAQMQENGVPVTYGYISDAHDNHAAGGAFGPGEAGYKAQLAAYDAAFDAFFQNLAAHGIDKSNTLLVVTADEGDHFAGGVGTPQTDGTLAYNHTICTDLAACPTNQIGEVDTNMNTLLQAAYAPNSVPGFGIHPDDAPTFFLNGNPSRTDPTVRTMEHKVAGLTSLDPYVRDSAGNVQSVTLTQALADPVEEQALHMVNADPARTPTFTMFANPDFFLQLSNCSRTLPVAECASPAFAWNHGDIQQEIGNTWSGWVGPGVASNGIDSSTWTDHTNLRPTILSLLGLHDDYVDDGRVLIEALTTKATPQTLIAHRETLLRLGQAYEQVNASFGQFAMDTLKASTKGIESSDDSVYANTEDAIQSLTAQRDTLASQMRAALNAAAFDGQALDEQQAKAMIDQADALLAQAQALSAA